MRKRQFIGASALALLCAFATHAQAPAANPFLGSWKLNLERSKLSGKLPAGYVSFRHYEDHGSGWMYHTIVNTYETGASFTITAARYDEKEYPVYTSPQLGVFLTTGTKTPRTVAFKKVDPHTLEFTDRYNGTVSARGVCTVSPDGKTLTITDTDFDGNGKKASDNVFVYDRQ